MPKKKSVPLIGSAGVHYVCAVLSMNGLIALPTVRNTKGIDIVVLDQEGSFMANLQVKTSHKKKTSWIIGDNYKQWLDDNNYYVFVRYYDEKFEAFLESSENVVHTQKGVRSCFLILSCFLSAYLSWSSVSLDNQQFLSGCIHTSPQPPLSFYS